MSEDPRLRLRHHRGVPVLHLAGDLDLYSALQLRQVACDLIDQALTPPAALIAPRDSHRGPQEAPNTKDAAATPSPHATDSSALSPPARWDVLVLDLAAVPFTDSAGLGTLVALLQRARAHQAGLAIAGAAPALQQTLGLMGLTRVMALFDSAEDAVDAAGAAPRA